MASSEGSETLEYTATWIVALVCTIIVVVSLLAERFLHYFGKVTPLALLAHSISSGTKHSPHFR